MVTATDWIEAMLKAFWTNKSGATAIEYGLIVACLSLTIVAAAVGVGNEVEDMFTNPNRQMQEAFSR